MQLATHFYLKNRHLEKCKIINICKDLAEKLLKNTTSGANKKNINE
jgi:hypothetical protein